MDELLSSNDSEGDADSDEVSKEREEELYAVLHYNDFSKGVPPELLQKYCISTDKNNEFVISFKNSAEQAKPISDRNDGSKPAIGQREGTPLKGTTGVTSDALPDSSSDDDVVIVESEPTHLKSKSSTVFESKTTPKRKRDLTDDIVELTHTLNQKKNVDVQLKLPPSRIKSLEGLESTSTKSKSALNPKKRYWEDGEERKLTVSTKNRNSINAEVETTLAPMSKKIKSSNDVQLSLNQNSKHRAPKQVESEMAPNPKKEKSTENDDGPKLTPVSDNSKQDTTFESTLVPNPKASASNDGTQTNPKSPLKVSTEVVIEEKSDSDDSSCIVVEDPEMNRKISLSSTESVVALLSSEEEVSGFSLNTTEDILYDSDGNVSDVIEKSQFEWEDVASPSTWTQEMRRYYNSSCERLRYFDHKLIRQQIKKGSRKDWMISPRDLYPNKRPQQRCLVCRQTGHVARNCPKSDPTCHMCGVQGHSNMDCPNSICLQCGRRTHQFTTVCRKCTHTLSRECFKCKQPGHESKACPEKWREFHSTTEGPLKKEKEPSDESHRIQCCNCGKANHTFEECNQQYMSTSTKSLPAYNWLFGRSSSHEDWRVGFSGFSPRNTFEPPFKKRKEHHGRHSFHDELPNWTPLPKTKNKKNKRRKKFRNSF